MTEEQYTELQNRLKSILQICLETLKPKLKTKAQMAQLQDLLIDYQNNEELADIIEKVVQMNQRLQSKITVNEETKNMIEEEQYKKLEDSLRNLEARERAYIKNQYQLKLYCEELQNKVEELEASKNELVVSTKKVILDLKRDNQDLINKIKNLAAQNQHPIDRGNDPIKQSKNQYLRKSNGHSIDKLPKNLKGEKIESSLRSKLEQYQQVIESIEAGRGRKYSSVNENKERMAFQLK